MAAAPPAAFVLIVVVVCESDVSVLMVAILLFGFVVTMVVLAVDLRAGCFVCMAFEFVVDVDVFDSVGSLKICGFGAGFDSVFSGDCSTLILWNVIADVSGIGSVIFGVATFCNVVK